MSQTQRILIVGATSAIAEALARRYAVKGARLYLLARDQERLARMQGDLKVRGAATVDIGAFDATAFADHERAVAQALATLEHVDIAVVAHGILPEPTEVNASAAAAKLAMDVNFTSVVTVLTPLANAMEAQKHGVIAVIGSVAGDRGRQSNYVYGAAKGGVAVFLQGLRNRLFRAGVAVVTIKPGFVDTPMTAAFAKGALWAKPEQVAAGIEGAIARRASTVYVPWFWRPIMCVIRSIPELVFKRMKL